MHLTRYVAVFEIYAPSLALRVSEVLQDFKIIARGSTIYAGRGIVRALTDAGPMAICEVTLHDNYWIDTTPASAATRREKLSSEFNQFVHDWGKFYLVSNEYKVVIADIHTFLSDLHLWIEQLELKITLAPTADRTGIESELVHDLGGQVTIALSNMFERFEAVSEQIEEDLLPAHRAFGQRQIHPHLLCGPFIHRTLGQASGLCRGLRNDEHDVRNGLEGVRYMPNWSTPTSSIRFGPKRTKSSRFPAGTGLSRKPVGSSDWAAREYLFTIACGPAWEAQDFLAQLPLADHARFRLLDFNEETLATHSPAGWKKPEGSTTGILREAG